VITNLDAPAAPTGAAIVQNIFATSAKTIDLTSPGFTQRPACGYTLTETFTWELPAGGFVTQLNNYSIKAESETASHRGVYNVKLIDSANYAGTGVTYSNETPFTVTMVDPCLTTTLTDFTVPAVSIEAGLTNTFNFVEVTDSAATAVSKPTICGARTYTVYKLDSNSAQQAQTLVTFTAGTGGA
jgi:hypothetical protein